MSYSLAFRAFAAFGKLRFCKCWLLVLLVLPGVPLAGRAQSFLHAAGPKIVNAANQEVLLNGVNLGGWTLQEGYIIKPGWTGSGGRQTQGAVKQSLYAAGMSDADVEAFYQSYRNNFITKPDIDFLASKGFNCIRLPLHYDLFLTPAQRAVRNGVLHGTTPYAAYVSSLTGWYNANQLFTDPANMEALRLIDNVLTWCAANNMYVVLDLHAAPGAQGTDTSIADALQPLDLWNQPIYQDITVRLWEKLAARYKNDARVAMYDLINEPNNLPANQPIHDLFERLITAVRAQGDNHLLLLEGNGWGNDFNYLTPNSFANAANLVYNSHRYSGTGYLLNNNVGTTDPGSPNNLRAIGNLTRFRSTWNVPIWVGETGENTDAWMHEAAVALNSVGIGWCHWTYKRFENGNNPALLHINSPFIVDGPAGLNQVLTNILFANCVPNSAVGAVAPNQNGIVNYPGGGSYNGASAYNGPALGRIYEISAKSSGKALEISSNSLANGGRAQQWTWVGAASQKWKLYDVGNGYVRIVNLNSNKSLDVAGPSTADGALTHQWDWLSTSSQYWQPIANGDGTYRLINQYSGKALDVQGNSTADGAAAQQWTYGGGDNQRWYFSDQGAGRTALASGTAQTAAVGFYPNPVADALTYQLPAGTTTHQVTVLDVAGRQVLAQTAEGTGDQHTLDVSALKSGLYFVRLAGPNFHSEFKISKQ